MGGKKQSKKAEQRAKISKMLNWKQISWFGAENQPELY